MVELNARDSQNLLSVVLSDSVVTYPCRTPRGEPVSDHVRSEPGGVGGSSSPSDSRGPKMRTG